MDDWKTAGIVAAALVAGLGVLFGTGVIELGDSAGEPEPSKPKAAPAHSNESPEEADDGEQGGGKPKGRRGGASPKVGVTVNVAGEATPGLALYNPSGWGKRYRKAARGKIFRVARLVDTDGNELRSWSSDFASDTKRGWATVRLVEDGSLYALNAREGFLKLSWDNELEWGTRGAYHHDFAIAEGGDVWVLTEQRRTVEISGNQVAILDNGISTITPDGVATERWWLYDTLAKETFFQEHLEARVQMRLDKSPGADLADKPMELIQANSIEILSRDVGDWRAGDLLLSLGELDLVVVVGPDGAHKWHWGAGELDRQHDATLLPDDHMLVFDNGFHRGTTRVLEIDPSDGNRIVWSWPPPEGPPFFSRIRGMAQKMPSGNVFIVNSHKGRTIEITPDGEVVWEFRSPDVLRGGIRLPFRMTKLEGKVLAATRQRLGLDDGDASADDVDADADESPADEDAPPTKE